MNEGKSDDSETKEFEEKLVKTRKKPSSSTPKKETTKHREPDSESESDVTLTSDVAQHIRSSRAKDSHESKVEQSKVKGEGEKYKCEKHRKTRERGSEERKETKEERNVEKEKAKSNSNQVENYVTSGMSHLSMSDVTEEEVVTEKEAHKKHSKKSRAHIDVSKHVKTTSRTNYTSSKQRPRDSKKTKLSSDVRIQRRAKSANVISSKKKKKTRDASPTSTISTLVRGYTSLSPHSNF